MSVRTPLARVEGLGAAHRGTEHFTRQRATAVALIPLAIWFLVSAFSLVGADRTAVAAFFEEPVNAILMVLFIASAMTHMKLGMQVVIEDYVHNEAGKVALLLLNLFFAWIVGVATLVALLKMALVRM